MSDEIRADFMEHALYEAVFNSLPQGVYAVMLESEMGTIGVAVRAETYLDARGVYMALSAAAETMRSYLEEHP